MHPKMILTLHGARSMRRTVTSAPSLGIALASLTLDALTHLLKVGTPVADSSERAPVAASITYHRSPDRRRRDKAKTLVG